MENATHRPGCSPETNLWLAVVQEVISTDSAEAAQSWLQSGDGRMVAAMAGLDPDWVADRILPEVNRQRHKGKRRYARQYFASVSRRRAEAVQDRYLPITW